jgi:hypothetical protein
MANEYEGMSIEELEAVRLEIASEVDAQKALFKSAGKVLDVKRAQTPEAKALKKIHEGREELAAIAAEEAEAAEEGGN